MNLKLLCLITNKENSLNTFLNKFKLPFNFITHGIGTASQSMLDFFGLMETEKVILFSIIPDTMEKTLLLNIKEKMNINDIGKGIAFTSPLSSSTKFINDSFNKKEGEILKNRSKYHLLITVVQEGYSDRVIDASKKAGANGGTLIKGREIASKNSFKFLNMTIEPEKEIVMIVCNDDDKNKIMEAIISKAGIKTDAKGLIFTMPIDNVVGLSEEVNTI